ncbi:MAG: hypothetical protein NTV21_08775 [Planctomycetota bacterium]|nr:hypothetical protein [Planctomycetota bacterium]
MKLALAFALVLVPLFGACASQASSHERRTTIVAADIERDLARVDTHLVGAQAFVKSVEAGDRRARLEKLLATARAERDSARAELAAYRVDRLVERVRMAADAAARAERLARAAERGEDLLAVE